MAKKARCADCRAKHAHCDHGVVAPEAAAPAPREYDRPAELVKTIGRLTLQLEKAKASKAELVAAVFEAAKDAAGALEIKPVGPAERDQRKATPETAIAVLADWQLGKVTPSYSSPVCEQRIERYGDRVVKLAEIQRRDHPVRELRVYCLGDLVEGELIFPGQAHRIDASLFQQVLIDGPRILGNFLRKMAANFERVHVVGVIGNHGRIGGTSARDYAPESNADSMLLEITRGIVQDEERITWAATFTPGERHWYAIDRIGEKGYFLFHGDQIGGGFAGYPWYGFGRAIMGWRAGGVPEPFDYSLSGHFHTPVRLLAGQITHWGSGSPESDNTYASEVMKARGRPSQWLLFAHPEHGVTSEYEVHL